MNSASPAKPRDILIYGWHPVFEALDEGKIIQAVWIESGDFNDQGHELWSRLKNTDIPVKRVPRIKLDKLVNNGVHQGVVAFVSPIEFVDMENVVQMLYERGETPRIALLDGLTDVRNLGAIARSAACFGIHGLIFPVKHSGQINAEVVKSSAGGIFKLAISRVKDVVGTVEALQASGLNVVCLDEKSDDILEDVNFSLPTLFVLGSEGSGIRQEVLDIANNHVKIEMSGAIDSLNVSVSAGIVFHSVFAKYGGKQFM